MHLRVKKLKSIHFKLLITHFPTQGFFENLFHQYKGLAGGWGGAEKLWQSLHIFVEGYQIYLHLYLSKL